MERRCVRYSGSGHVTLGPDIQSQCRQRPTLTSAVKCESHEDRKLSTRGRQDRVTREQIRRGSVKWCYQVVAVPAQRCGADHLPRRRTSPAKTSHLHFHSPPRRCTQPQPDRTTYLEFIRYHLYRTPHHNFSDSYGKGLEPQGRHTMDDFNSETDSDYTSYWRDWVGALYFVFAIQYFPPVSIA
jgi:hypothetical protein